MKRITLFTIVLIGCFLSSPVIAAKGAYPGSNGKPFQALQEQVDAVEARVDVIEAAIIDLQDQIDQLVFDTSNLETRIAVNEQFIAELQAENLDIKADIQAIIAELQALGVEVDINAADIQALIVLHQVNTAKIDYLEGQIADLQVEVDGKQEPLFAGCTVGYAIRNISPEGYATCEEIPETQTAGFTTISTDVVTTDDFNVPPSTRYCELEILGICVDWSAWSEPLAHRYVYCPSGWFRAGGGHLLLGNQNEVTLTSDQPSEYYPNAWIVQFRRLPGTTGSAEAHARINCLKFE